MKFAQFDPRPRGAEANEKIFAEGPVFGVEVTIPALATRCIANLDHHGPTDTSETPSACEQALVCDLPPIETTFATVRPDADSITAMAVISNRLTNMPVDGELVRAIGSFDRTGRASARHSDIIAALARVATDFKRPLVERIKWIANVLVGKIDQDEVARLVAERDAEFAAAKAASEAKLTANGRIAVVVSTHRFATGLGYDMASVVVAMNPAMVAEQKDIGKTTYVKYTVCRYDSHVPVDLPAALKELQTLESGWGGSANICGSPQGVSSNLTLDQVVKIVEKHLK